MVTGPDDTQELTASFPWLELKGSVRGHLEALTAGLVAVGGLGGRCTLDRIVANRLVVVDADDAVVAASDLGFPASLVGGGAPGLDVRGSFLQVRSCQVRGKATTVGSSDGGPGARVVDGAELLAVECNFAGGDDLSASLPLQVAPGPGIEVGPGCRIDLRGTTAATTTGGQDLLEPSEDAAGVALIADAVAYVSASHSPVFKSGAGFLFVDEGVRPWLDYASSVVVGPAASWQVAIHAENDVLVAFFLGLQSEYLVLPEVVVGTPVLVNVASAIASTVVPGNGQGTPPVHTIGVPDNASLIGLQLHLQAYAVRTDGRYDGTNGGALLLRD